MATRTETAVSLQTYTEAFAKLSAQDGGGSSALHALRQRAFALFAASGFPTTRQEEWRFTNVAPIARTRFTVDAGARVEVKETEFTGFAPSGDESYVVTFIDGVWSPSRSHIDGLPAGVNVSPLLGATGNGSKQFLDRLGALTDLDSNPFAALNTSLFTDGVLIAVGDRTIVERPIHVVMITTQDGTTAPRAVFPRILVFAGRESECSIAEIYQGDASGLTNAVAEFSLEEGSKVHHDRIQMESLLHYHINTLTVRQAQGSVFTSNAVTFGGALVRNGLHVTLAGSGAECTLNGLAIGTGTQHIDNHTSIDHAAERCTSHELYKTILNDSAHGVFNGKIFVRPGAQKTDAKQTNKTVLLSDSALMNTKPQLEIFADDVKCTHGATVGQLDDEQLFYLRARGIGKDEARDMLTLAFANDVVTRVHDRAVREQLDHLLRQRLEGDRRLDQP